MEDPVIAQFSEYGSVEVASQNWIDSNATYPGVPEGNLYLLNQDVGGLIQIYVYDDIDEYPISMQSEFNRKWEE